MKKTISLLLSLLLLFSSAVALADEPHFVTISEWLEAKGECGDCLMLVQLQEILNPVVAVAADETGVVHLWSGGGDERMEFNFVRDGSLEYYKGYIFVISNPVYNEFEGNVELANWTLVRFMPPISR